MVASQIIRMSTRKSMVGSGDVKLRKMKLQRILANTSLWFAEASVPSRQPAAGKVRFIIA